MGEGEAGLLDFGMWTKERSSSRGDETENGIDYVILATGYEVHFPFPSEKYIKNRSPITSSSGVERHLVFPLARHLFSFAGNDTRHGSDLNSWNSSHIVMPS